MFVVSEDLKPTANGSSFPLAANQNKQPAKKKICIEMCDPAVDLGESTSGIAPPNVEDASLVYVSPVQYACVGATQSSRSKGAVGHDDMQTMLHEKHGGTGIGEFESFILRTGKHKTKVGIVDLLGGEAGVMKLCVRNAGCQAVVTLIL